MEAIITLCVDYETEEELRDILDELETLGYAPQLEWEGEPEEKDEFDEELPEEEAEFDDLEEEDED